MDEVPANIQPFPGQGSAAWIDTYQEEMLQARDEATIETYTRVLEKFTAWLALRPGNSGQFRPQAITRTAIEDFLDTLPSYSYKKQARTALWLLSLAARRSAASGTQSHPGRFDTCTSIACSS